MSDPYVILGVSPNATDEEISKAYKALARKYHPDLNPGDKAAEAKMQEINAAYELIKDIHSGKASRQSYQSDNATGDYGNGYGASGNYQQNGYGSNGYQYYYRSYQPNGTRYYRVRHFSLWRLVVGFLILQGLMWLVLSACSWFGRSQYPDYGQYGYGSNQPGYSEPDSSNQEQSDSGKTFYIIGDNGT